MSGGIRATVAFSGADVCAIADLARAADCRVDTVSRSVAGDDTAPVTEFAVEGDRIPGEDLPDAVSHVISYGSSHRYRLRHEGVGPCPCTVLGGFGLPLERYFAREGTLTLAFHAADYEELQAVVGALRERYPDVDIRRLVRSPTAEPTTDDVFVDRSKLTDRQHEVLRTAFERGYFDHPRETTATELAADLGVDTSTFTEHLAAAQSKLLGDALEDDG